MSMLVRPTVPLRLLATSQAWPTDLPGDRGAWLDNDAVCARVLGPDWRAVLAARAALRDGAQGEQAAQVTHADASVGVPAPSIRPETPVQRRQWLHGDAHAIDLGLLAARRALAAAGLQAEALSAIVCVTSTPPVVSAAMAARIGAALGAAPAAEADGHPEAEPGLQGPTCFDIRAGGVGVMQAWFTAQGLIAQGAGPVLIVAAEASSAFLAPGDLGSALLYADGAAACILAVDEATPPDAPLAERTGFLGGITGQARMAGRPTTIPGVLPPPLLPAALWASPAAAIAAQHDALHQLGDALARYRFQRPDRAHLAALSELWRRGPAELAAAWPEAHAALRHLLPYPVSLAQMALAHEAMGQPQAELFHQLPELGCVGAASPLVSLHGLLQTGRARPGEVIALFSAAGNGLWAGFFWRLA